MPPVPIDVAGICVCDLRDVPAGWAHEGNGRRRTGLRSIRGSAAWCSARTSPARSSATFHTGFSRPIGGGEYERTPAGDALATQRSGERRRSAAAAPRCHREPAAGSSITDSLTYAETPTFTVDGVTGAGQPGLEVVVTARNGARPLIAASGPMLLDIGARGRLVLEGLVISGGELQIGGCGRRRAAGAGAAPLHARARACG